ncbi:hypothetical protein CR513_44435, partial [Mucuna pruriens]
MEECKSVSTPMNQKEKLSKEDGADKIDEGYYRSLIGCLMYLDATRPDILFAVSLLTRFMHCASEIHVRAVKRILRILFQPRLWSFLLVQEILAQSTVEAEFIVAIHLLRSLYYKPNGPNSGQMQGCIIWEAPSGIREHEHPYHSGKARPYKMNICGTTLRTAKPFSNKNAPQTAGSDINRYTLLVFSAQRGLLLRHSAGKRSKEFNYHHLKYHSGENYQQKYPASKHASEYTLPVKIENRENNQLIYALTDDIPPHRFGDKVCSPCNWGSFQKSIVRRFGSQG